MITEESRIRAIRLIKEYLHKFASIEQLQYIVNYLKIRV